MSKKNIVDISGYQDKKLVAFDLYGTCIHRPEGIFHRGFSIDKELKKILEKNPIDIDQIEKGDLVIDGVEIKLSKKILNRVKRDIEGILLYPDFLETIKYLKSKGYKTAVVSNLAKPYEEPLNTKVPEGTFDYKSLSFDIGAMKPNPKIFQHISDVSGIDFSDMVFIGDSLGSDVLGSAKMGMKPIYINRGHKHTFEKGEKNGVSYIQIGTLDQLKDIL